MIRKSTDGKQRVLSLSYGKDSMACLGAIELLDWPLDRIITAEVWATDTIQADLPPMVEFKKYADKVIKERYGIEVEHTCAMKKRKTDTSLGGEKDSLMNDSSTVSVSTNNSKKKYCTDSPAQEEVGAKILKPEAAEWEKVIYDKLYSPRTRGKRQISFSILASQLTSQTDSNAWTASQRFHRWQQSDGRKRTA